MSKSLSVWRRIIGYKLWQKSFAEKMSEEEFWQTLKIETRSHQHASFIDLYSFLYFNLFSFLLRIFKFLFLLAQAVNKFSSVLAIPPLSNSWRYFVVVDLSYYCKLWLNKFIKVQDEKSPKCFFYKFFKSWSASRYRRHWI